MTTVTLVKDLPSSGNFYTGGGAATSVTISAEEVNPHTKKDFEIFIQQEQGPADEVLSDKFINLATDVRKGKDEFSISGWLDDDTTDTAWNKYWKLRAMMTSGGPLLSFTVADKSFESATQCAFIEDLQGSVKSDDTGPINTAQAEGTARVHITMNVLIAENQAE